VPPFAVDLPVRVLAVVCVGWSVVLAGPLLGGAILWVADFSERSWHQAPWAGPILGGVATLLCVLVGWTAPQRAARRALVAGAIAAIAGGVASFFITLAVGVFLALISHPNNVRHF
jgi:hypothetical protein